MYGKTETYHLFNAFVDIVLLWQCMLTVIYSSVCVCGGGGGGVNTSK